jgi:hypothetical protein
MPGWQQKNQMQIFEIPYTSCRQPGELNAAGLLKFSASIRACI